MPAAAASGMLTHRVWASWLSSARPVAGALTQLAAENLAGAEFDGNPGAERLAQRGFDGDFAELNRVGGRQDRHDGAGHGQRVEGQAADGQTAIVRGGNGNGVTLGFLFVSAGVVSTGGDRGP